MVHADPDALRVTTYGVAGADSPLEVVDRFEIVAPSRAALGGHRAAGDRSSSSA
jgi:hypothetical protein